MLRTPRLRRLLVTAAVLAGFVTADVASAQGAPSSTQYAAVIDLEGGWVDDALSINHAAPMVNPGQCPVVNAGYATNPADPGHSLFHTLLLSALLNHREVALLINGCVYGKPRVIAVRIR